MIVFTLVRKSLRQHALSSTITALSIGLAAGLILSVWTIKDQSHQSFTSMNAGFDGVLGARSSKLQLVLNAIFQIEASPGNLPWSDFLDIQSHPGVKTAIPVALGDNYRGFRLAGVTPELFTDVEFAPGRRYQVQTGGRLMSPDRREAVVGSFVAQTLGLKVGDTFHPYHGLLFNEEDQHAETYVVVGILEPSSSPVDRVIWIPLAGIQHMSGHDPAMAQDISAVLVQLKTPQAGFRLDLLYNKQGNRLTFAWPIDQIMAQLFQKISWFDRVLAMVAYLVALVATASVFTSIYNSMNERRRDLAILRALGAHRRVLFGAVVLEAASITALGMIPAFILYGAIFQFAAALIQAQTGVVLTVWQWHPIFLWTPAVMILLGALSGLVPAIKAYRTSVAEHLSPQS